MGASHSGQWVDQIPVPETKANYPSPEPPSFLLPDLLKTYKIRETSDNNDGNIDWKLIRDIATLSIDEQAAIETGKLTPGERLDVSDKRNKGLSALQRAGKDSNAKDERTGVDVSINQTKGDTNLDNGTNEVGKQHKASNKISFDEIDQHAREAKPQHRESFQGLFDYLAEKIPPTRYRDVFLVRGITAWFCNQDVDSLKPVTASLASPAGLVQHIRNKSLSITSSYALLIRAAKLPCVIIKGLEKSGHTDSADHDIIDGQWCAVYVDKSWQLIHPRWTCRGTYNIAKEKQNFVLIEEDEQKDNDVDEKLAGLQKPKEPPIKFIIQDDFFMPNPGVFKYKCNAFERKWNLLSKEVNMNPKEEFKTMESTLSIKEQFKMMAYLSPAFFKMNLKLVSAPYSTLYAEGGNATIELELPADLTRKVLFSHKLSIMDVDQPTDKTLISDNLSRQVLYHRCNNRAVFEISLLAKGTYMFGIKGGIKEMFYNIAQFRLISTEDQDASLLPFDAGIDGWGPGPKTQASGLLVPSKPKGIITYQAIQDVKTNKYMPQHISICFDISRERVENTEYTVEIVRSLDMKEASNAVTGNAIIKGEKANASRETSKQRPIKDFTTQKHGVVGSSSRPPDMKKWFTCTKDRLARKLEIDVMIPEAGIYGLIIRSTDLEDKPLNMKAMKKGTTKDGPKLKFAQTELLRAMKTDSYSDMSTAVDRCLLLGLEVTNEDIAASQVRMEYVKLKTDINDCIKRRNLSVLNDTLLRVLKYKYRAALVDQVEELLDFRRKILAIDGYQLYLPTIKEAIDELYKMPKIPPEVHNTVGAVLVLLKHPIELLDWSYIKNQLRVSGGRSVNLAKQIERYENANEPPDIHDIKQAEQVLYMYTFPKVLHVNHSAATFYKWVEAITIRLQEFEQAQRNHYEILVTRQAAKDYKRSERRRKREIKREKNRHLSF